MKEIRLTVKQREVLLEMAIKLFPEYPQIMYGRKNYPFTDYLWLCGINGNLIEEIHWFEFCYTALLPKIRITLDDLAEDNVSFGANIIDYLHYQLEVLKIKNLI